MPDHACPEYKDDSGAATGNCWLKTNGWPVEYSRDCLNPLGVRCINWLGPEEGGRQLKRSASTI